MFLKFSILINNRPILLIITPKSKSKVYLLAHTSLDLILFKISADPIRYSNKDSSSDYDEYIVQVSGNEEFHITGKVKKALRWPLNGVT